MTSGTSGSAAAATSTKTGQPPSQAPDLWGFYDSRTKLGDVYTANADVYSPQNGGLGWSWQRPSHAENSVVINLADKQLEFERESTMGVYRLKTVTGRSWMPVLDAIQWNSSAQDFHVFTSNSKGTVDLKEVQPSKPGGDITAMSFPGFSKAQAGWAINYAGAAVNPNGQTSSSPVTQILYTADGGRIWSVLKSFPGERLKSVHFSSDGKNGWVAGNNGVLLGTLDGGASWRPLTVAAGRLLWLGKWSAPKDAKQYVRFVPPWYLLVLLICGVLATPVLFPVDETATPSGPVPDLQIDGASESSSPKHVPGPTVAGVREADASTIGNQAIADKPLEPGDPDALGLSTIAAGLAFFLRNQKTRPPLAIAINGRWGSGKISPIGTL